MFPDIFLIFLRLTGSETSKDRLIFPLIRDVFKNKRSKLDKFKSFNLTVPVNI